MEYSKSTPELSDLELLAAIPRKSFSNFYTKGELKGEGGFGIVFKA